MAHNKVIAEIGPAKDGFVLEDYPLYHLIRAAATYSTAMSDALKEYGLDITKWRILMLLDDAGPSAVGDLSRRAVIKMPTITRVLIRMEKDGLVERAATEADRRIIEVTMTDKAIETLAVVKDIGQRVFEMAFDGLSLEEAGELTGYLKKIRANLDRSPYANAALMLAAGETAVS